MKLESIEQKINNEDKLVSLKLYRWPIFFLELKFFYAKSKPALFKASLI